MADKGITHSIQARLLAHAKREDADPNVVLARYGIERLLYRLSVSPHRGRFVLKGALLLLVWFGDEIRPTRDADLLGFGELSDEALAAVFREVCAVQCDPDGMAFQHGSVQVSAIRENDQYGGQRVTLLGLLGSVRIRVQVDVGIGDAVTPAPRRIEYPCLLGLPAPKLRAYRPETSIAEKFHAMVVLGGANSRMKDFFDIYVLASRLEFDGEGLAAAIRDTFGRRKTEIPAEPPLALTPSFGEDERKRAQWQSFVRKNRLSGVPDDLLQVVHGLAVFLWPPLQALQSRARFAGNWKPGGPWVS